MDKTAEEPLFKGTASQDDSFYDTIETASPEYDNAVNQSQDPAELARQHEEYRKELAKLEEEISTLRTVLGAKVYQASELKKKLGITPMVEIKHDLKQGLQNIKESDAYLKTNQAFKSFGAFASKKLGDVKSSNMYKSFEGKVGGAYSSVKSKVRGSQSEQNFSDALSASAGSDIDGASGTEVDTTSATSPGEPEKKPL